MECSEVRAVILEDPELRSPLKESVEAHLDHCPSCAKLFENLREQAQALRDLPRVEAPAGFVGQVRSRVDKPSGFELLFGKLSGVFSGRRFFRFAGVAATAVLVVVTAQIMLREEGNKGKAPVPPPPAVDMKTRPANPAMPAGPPPRAMENRPEPQAMQAAPAPLLKAMPRAAKRDSFKAGEMVSGQPAQPGPKTDRELSTVFITVKLPPVLMEKRSLPLKSAAPARPAPAEPSRGRAQMGGHALDFAPAPADSDMRDALAAVRRMVSESKGKILPGEGTQDESRQTSVIAEIPAAGYRSFLDRLRRVGEIGVNGDEHPKVRPDQTIRVVVDLSR